MKKVSIIMLQHNRSDHTIKTLSSLYMNTDYTDFNIRIGDVCSDEFHFKQLKTEEVYYRKTCGNIVVTQMKDNFSIGANKNILIHRAMKDCQYLCVFDNDMTFEPDWLPTAIELFEANNADLLGLWKHPLHTMVEDKGDVVIMNNIPGNCWMMRSNLFAETLGLKEIALNDSSQVGEDTEYIFRTMDMGKKVLSVKKDLMHHFGKVRSDGTPSADAKYI